METNWKEVAKIEREIEENNDPKFLVKFIELLTEHKLLNRHMLSAICGSATIPGAYEKMWELLHIMAGEEK